MNPWPANNPGQHTDEKAPAMCKNHRTHYQSKLLAFFASKKHVLERTPVHVDIFGWLKFVLPLTLVCFLSFLLLSRHVTKKGETETT